MINKIKIIWQIFGLALLYVLSSTGVVASTLAQVEIFGNAITKDYVILQEMQSQVGEELDAEKLHDDIQAIRNLGIFSEVEYYIYAADSLKKDHVKVLIEVKEKYFLFILPDLRYDEEEKAVRLGVRAYWDNINGSNQSLRFKVRERGTVLGVRDVLQDVDYTMPRINGSAYNLTLFRSTRHAAVEFENEAPQLRDESKFGFDLFRWFHLKSRSSGTYLGLGLYNEKRHNEALYSTDADKGSFDGSFWGFRVGYRKVDEYLFNRRGRDFGYRVDTTRFLFDQKENYTRHLLFYRSYYRLKSNPRNNLNVQVQLGVSEGDYLGDTEFSIGGKLLRGYEKGEYIGNAMLLMNLEYLLPFGDNPAYRYGLILDIGNTYESFDAIDLTDMHTGVGVGFRWKLKDFVRVNLRLDIAYAVDTGGTNILINSRHLF